MIIFCTEVHVSASNLDCYSTRHYFTTAEAAATAALIQMETFAHLKEWVEMGENSFSYLNPLGQGEYELVSVRMSPIEVKE